MKYSTIQQSEDFDLYSKFFPTLIESQCLSKGKIEKVRKQFEEELSRKIIVYRTPKVIVGRRFKKRPIKRTQRRYPTRIFVNSNYLKTELSKLKEELVSSIMDLEQKVTEVEEQIAENQVDQEIQEIDLNDSMITLHEFQPGKLWKGCAKYASEDEKAKYSSSSSSSSGVWSPTSSSLSPTLPVEDFFGSKISPWIIIENVKSDVDESTLITLLLQHGPHDVFEYYREHGIAICRYLLYDQALRASRGINQCLINNKVVSSRTPSEYEIKLLLDFIL